MNLSLNLNLSQIASILAELKNPEKIEIFLKEIFTESEIKDLVQRWNILKMLDENQSQRNISKALGVSLCKVTRGAKILKDKNSITKKILTKSQERWRK